MKLGARARIPARKEGDVMSQFDQLIHQPGDHPFRAAVKLWGNALGQGSKLGDAHEAFPLGPQDRSQRQYDHR